MPVFQCNGADLYYEDHGAGQSIVCLHGAAAGLRYFELQLTGLSNEYRTLAFDFRGHGRTRDHRHAAAVTQRVKPTVALPTVIGPRVDRSAITEIRATRPAEIDL
jgi:pimeloyl-ACP methyl ester carboxylesterase